MHVQSEPNQSLNIDKRSFSDKHHHLIISNYNTFKNTWIHLRLFPKLVNKKKAKNQVGEEERHLCAPGMCAWHAILAGRHMAAAHTCMFTVGPHWAAVINSKQVSLLGFYSFSSLVNSEKKCIGSFLPFFFAWFHEHTFVMGTGGQAALNGCVNTRDGNQVAAMPSATVDRVFDRDGCVPGHRPV